MKFKRYLIILTLFFVLFAAISAVSAVSDDSLDNATSQAEDSISQTGDDKIAEDAQESNVEGSISDDNIVKQENQSSDKLSVAESTPSKSNVKITTYSNFVKKGSNYYMYLMDSHGNPVSNKKLNIKYDGKTITKTTDKSGMVGVKVKSSKSDITFEVSFKGDDKYNPVSKTLKVYIDKSLSITIGNTKLLTNGYLRVYLSGPKKLVSKKKIKIKVGKKVFTRKTTYEGFAVIKPDVRPGNYLVQVQYKNYNVSKKVNCIAGKVSDPLKTAIPTQNGVPDIDVMPRNYVMADNNAQYTLKKSQYRETIKRDSYTLFLHEKLSKYTFFKTKHSPKTYHIIKRQKWNAIERAINTKMIKKNRYNYWPSSITVSLKGKSYTYSEVRDIQNTEYTCGPTSSSVCSQALKNFYSEKYFQIKMHCYHGVNIPVIKKVLEQHHFKASYYHGDTFNSAINQLKHGAALGAFLKNHYVAIIDISPDGKKILVSNSYGSYNVGGANKVPTGWVSVKYFKTKFAGVGLVLKLNYKLSKNTQNQINCFYSSMGPNWHRQNTKERIPDIGL